MNKENQVSTIRDHSKAYVFVLAASTVLDRYQIVEKPRVTTQKYYDNVYRILKHYGVPLSGLPRNVDGVAMRNVRSRLIDKNKQVTKDRYQSLFDSAQKYIVGILGPSPADPPSDAFDLELLDSDFGGKSTILHGSRKENKVDSELVKDAIIIFRAFEFGRFSKLVSDCRLSDVSAQTVVWKANRGTTKINIKAYRDKSVLKQYLRTISSILSGHVFVRPDYVVPVPRADFAKLLASQELCLEDFIQDNNHILTAVFKTYGGTVNTFIQRCKASMLHWNACFGYNQKPDANSIAPSVKDLLIFSVFETTLNLHHEGYQHTNIRLSNIVMTVDPASITVLSQDLYRRYYAEGADPFVLFADGGSITSTGEVSVTPETDGYNISPNGEAVESRPRIDYHSLALLVAEVVTEHYLHEMFPKKEEEEWEEWGQRVWNDKANSNGKIQAKIKELWPKYHRELLKHVLKGINPHLVDDDWGKEGMEIMVDIMEGYKKNPLP